MKSLKEIFFKLTGGSLNKRQIPRREVKLGLRYREVNREEDFKYAFVCNASLMGLLIETKKQLLVDSIIELKFSLPKKFRTDFGALKIKAQVKHCRQTPHNSKNFNCGIQFIDTEFAERRILDRILTRAPQRQAPTIK